MFVFPLFTLDNSAAITNGPCFSVTTRDFPLRVPVCTKDLLLRATIRYNIVIRGQKSCSLLGHNMQNPKAPIKLLDVSQVKHSHCIEEGPESLAYIADLELSEGDARSPEGLAGTEDSA